MNHKITACYILCVIIVEFDSIEVTPFQLLPKKWGSEPQSLRGYLNTQKRVCKRPYQNNEHGKHTPYTNQTGETFCVCVAEEEN